MANTLPQQLRKARQQNRSIHRLNRLLLLALVAVSLVMPTRLKASGNYLRADLMRFPKYLPLVGILTPFIVPIQMLPAKCIHAPVDFGRILIALMPPSSGF